MGYEDEILDLMHKLVASHKQVKGNGSPGYYKKRERIKKVGVLHQLQWAE